jgi:hypothetical protein
MLYCSAVQSSVDESFKFQDLGLKLNWEAPMDGLSAVLAPVSRMER